MNIPANIYKLIRAVIVGFFSLVLGCFIIAYLSLFIPACQNKIRQTGEKELSKLLKTKVEIGKISIRPFNEVVVYDVNIPDQKGNKLININQLGAGISIYQILAHQKIVFTYAELIGLNASIYKDSIQGQANVQFLIDALSKKDPNKPPTPFDLKFHNVVIRQSAIAYNVLSEPKPENGTFSKNHISINNIRADISLPRLTNDDFTIDVKRLSLNEQSGFAIKHLSTLLHLSKDEIAVKDFDLKLPESALEFDSISVPCEKVGVPSKELFSTPIDFSTKKCVIVPADFSCFLPKLSDLKQPINLQAHVQGTIDNLKISTLKLNSGNNLNIALNGYVSSVRDMQKFNFNAQQFDIQASNSQIEQVVSMLAKLPAKTQRIIRNLGDIHLKGNASGTKSKFNFKGFLNSALGQVDLNGDFDITSPKARKFKGSVITESFQLGRLIANNNIGSLAANIEVDASLSGKNVFGSLDGNIPFFEFKNYRYHNIVADINANKNEYLAAVDINDANCNLAVNSAYFASNDTAFVSLQAFANHIDLNALNLFKKHPDKEVSFEVVADASIFNNSEVFGYATISNLAYQNENKEGLHIREIDIEAKRENDTERIEINSDIITGWLAGNYNFKTIVPAAKSMAAEVLPALVKAAETYQPATATNEFDFAFTVKPNEELHTMLKLPIKILHDVDIAGNFRESEKSFSAQISAPYLLNGKKIIEGSHLAASLDSTKHAASLEVSTIIPLQKGKTTVQLNANAANDRLDTNLGWKIDTPRDYSGNLNFSTLFERNDENRLDALVNINPTRLVFNDTTWQVHPAKIDIKGTNINIEGVKGTCMNQYVSIDGAISKEPDDEVLVELNEMSLDYIFEALSIDNVMFGGIATGKFYASQLYSGFPHLSTPGLHVKGLAYNKAVLGDADITSQWLNDEKAITLKADINQYNGYNSKVDGAIYPSRDSLWFDFNCEKVNVAFMRPFMAAFTSHVEGLASGHAKLSGTFADLDMEGDVFAEDLCLKIDFTNCYYYTTDSVHIERGLIDIRDIDLRDAQGNTAKLNGWVKHKCFHDPSFQFRVTDCDHLLCYDMPQKPEQNWYGKIYANGSAIVNGEPGVINITVRMATATDSQFTFMISNSETANTYKFVTYVDRNRSNEPVEEVQTIPQAVLDIIAKNKTIQDTRPSSYFIDLQADITPEAQLTLIMDPISGDKIRANGSGNMRMTYNSTDEALNMYGKYTLEKGTYNFTLQDVFIKEFTIREGSSISFDGNPYTAQLDINAIYSLTANVQDLDESFATDRELQRTNVPVYAVLKAKGDMRQPEIDFDLEFPTLSSDAYRKVKSIISTEDMMNRQIIYLLALNRFYTPEYMGGVSKNNELASVAASTLSSQLRSILGQLSDKWSIAPNFRSDNGDFSDVQIDVALSSRLLNNRLIFNGNLGYRDNSMNTRNSNFIGDFDIEYLLNKRGTIRLKAYNHFNDQSFYVKNSLTTQGVGVEFKFDFDNPFARKPKRQQAAPKPAEPADSTQIKTEPNSQNP